MSVIGGFIFASKNTDSSGGPSSATVAELTNLRIYQKYIELLTIIQTERFDNLIQPIEDAVQDSMKEYTIDCEISIQDFKIILEKIQKSMSFLLLSDESKMKILFDAKTLTSSDLSKTQSGISLSKREENTLKSMLDETQDILEGQDFRKVLEASIDVGYAVLLDSLLETFMVMETNTPKASSSQHNTTASNTAASTSSDFSNPNAIKIRLAKIIPQIRKTVINKTETQQKELVNHLLCLDVLNCFAANIYEAFCAPSSWN